MNIVNWMEPIIWNPTTKSFHRSEPLTARKKRTIEATPHTTELRAKVEDLKLTDSTSRIRVEEKVHSETATEWVFIIISLVVRQSDGLWFSVLCEESESRRCLGHATADRCISPVTTNIGLTNSSD
jgi:hypothetical protein